MKPGLTEYIKFSDGIQEKFGGLFVASYLTKRGSALARKYLYFAALRLIKSDPLVSAWYRSKVDPRAKSGYQLKTGQN
jgi:hypothetical protein